MAGPWEAYASQDKPKTGGGPWEAYTPSPDAEQPKTGLQKVWEHPTPGGLVDLAKRAYGAFTLPGEVYQGKVDPRSEEGIQRAAEMASVVTPGAPGRMPAVPTAPSPVSAGQLAAEAGSRLGVDIPRFMTAEGAAIPKAAEGLKAIPWAGEPLIAASQKLRTQLGEKTGEISPPTATDVAGGAAKHGLSEFITEESKVPVSDAYTHVESLLSEPDARVPLAKSSEEVSKIMAERANSKIAGTSGAVSILKNAISSPEGMNYEGIKGLRSYLGERTPQELIAEGINPKEAKRLYGPLTEDLRSAVEAAGGKPAVAAWEEANTLARVTAEKREQLAKIVGSKGDVPAEQVFSRLLAKAGSTKSADVAALQEARKAMGPEAWGAFTAGVISKMGRDVQGEFSPDRFVTAYSGLSPKSREMFAPEQRKALDDMLIVTERVKEKISKFANVSKSAHTHSATAMITGFVGGLATGNFQAPAFVLGTLAGGRLASSFLARPAIVKAATDLGWAQVEGNIWKMIDKSEALQRVIFAEFPLMAHVESERLNIRRQDKSSDPSEHRIVKH